jgi:hypothetical protein
MKSHKRSFVNEETFILINICSCGHNKNSHLGLNRCYEENCNCKRFIP